MGSVPQIQWNLNEITSGYTKDFIWSLAVRTRGDHELDRFLYFIKETGSCMVVIRDSDDLWTLFLCHGKRNRRLATTSAS
jgi:hypothetical protein